MLFIVNAECASVRCVCVCVWVDGREIEVQ